MLVLEVLKSAAAWEWVYQDDNAFEINFKTIDNEYAFIGEYNERTDSWNVYFVLLQYDEYSQPQLQSKVTGTGNEFVVFSTVIDIIREFIQLYNPTQIDFSADEPNRQQLYKSLVRRKLPNWNYTLDNKNIVLTKLK